METENKKQYLIVDPDTGEVVGRETRGRSVFVKFVLGVIGCILGFAVYTVVSYIFGVIIGFIGKIPIIGEIVYFPSGASLVEISTRPVVGVASAVWIGKVISKSSRPVVYSLIVICVVNIILSFITASLVKFNVPGFFVNLLTIVASIVVIYSSDESETEKWEIISGILSGVAISVSMVVIGFLLADAGILVTY